MLALRIFKLFNHASWVKYTGEICMKHDKRILIGILLLTTFVVNMVAPASAYAYGT
jgi:hypothetical protein